MFDSILRVKYMNLKTGFLYLSPKHSHLNTGACLRLTYNDNEVAYFSASITRNIVDLDNIGINSLYAKALGMKENNFVNVSEIEQLPVVNSISIQPYNKTDFEVLELLAHNVQSHLLDQIRIINAGQKIVIWIGNISVVVLVDNVQPIYPGALDFLTEVVIKPPDSNMNRSEHKNSSEYMEGFIAFLNANITNTHTSLVEVKNLKPDFELFYRIIPLSELPINIKYLQPFKMFTWKEGLYGEFFTDNSENLFFTMTLLQNSYSAKELYVEVCFLDDLLDVSSVYLNNLSGNIYVDNSVLNYFQCESGVRVSLKTIKNQLARPSEIEVQHGLEKNSKDVLEHLKLLLSQSNDKPQVLNANFPIRIEDNFYYSLKFPPNLNSYYIINGNTLRDCSFSFHTESVRPLEEIRNEKSKEMFCMSLSIVQRISDNILSVVWRKGYFQSENVILTGKTGMGKSKLLNHIVSILQKYPYFVYTETVECKTIKGKTIDSLHKIFMDLFSKLVLCQPSVLVLDDLNILCESCDGEETPNNVYFNRVSEMLCNLLSSYPESNKIAIIASTDSVSKLNKHIYRSRGNHLFKNIFALNDLNKTDRVHLLEYFFQQANSKNLDYKELAVKTDGFVIQDIKDFYEKALFEAYKGPHLNEYPVVNQDNCELALKKTCSLSLQNVKFHSPGNKSFDNIGGLSEVKKILTESFLWPVKYSNIFSKAPLRLQSGLLLYGLPGTGKTLLAGAAAKQCSLRLISVKGPELLSKYIGASEQAVRDVFEKAQRAKPCILFFDEFDSLAPRRGHDNTGVTDRVVNQLLTQLDGVESLTGVCVLAATSRPDLLDPALLRPGRLDKQILCPMPDEKGRLEILKILSTTLDFENEVDLEEIADKTEGFSGADLQSLLYSVQISSMKTMEDPELSIVKNKITQSVLLDSLSKTRPSLTKREKDKYERIYAKFQGGNLEDFKTGSKVTLA